MIRRILPAALLVLALSACAHRPESREVVVGEMTAAVNEAADILDTVKDEETSKAAVPRLHELSVRMKAIGTRMERFKTEPSASEREALRPRGERLERATARLEQSMLAAAGKPGGRHAVEALDVGLK